MKAWRVAFATISGAGEGARPTSSGRWFTFVFAIALLFLATGSKVLDDTLAESVITLPDAAVTFNTSASEKVADVDIGDRTSHRAGADEVILATNPTVEGEAAATYLTQQPGRAE